MTTATVTNAVERVSQSFASRTERHDLRSRWFGIGRTVLAVTQLSFLLLTPMKALNIPVIGMAHFPRCDSVRAASALCLGGDSVGDEPRRWFLVAVLLVVASGYRPRWTAVPHAWAAYSLAVSIAVPDGGESVTMIICFLLVPIGLADDRTWHWQGPTSGLSPTARTVTFAAFLAVRVQIAYLYLDSAISKFGVSDWANGTAEYYFLRDTMFGVAAPWDSLLLWLSKISLVTVAMTWGALLIEIAIGVCVLSKERWRKVGLVLDIVLHGSIILTMGLWSFGLAMIGSAVLCSAPDRAKGRTRSTVAHEDIEGRPDPARSAPIPAASGSSERTPVGTA